MYFIILSMLSLPVPPGGHAVVCVGSVSVIALLCARGMWDSPPRGVSPGGCLRIRGVQKDNMRPRAREIDKV